MAHDLRVLLRERLKAGDTDAQAKAFIVARYGHYVLLKPPVEGQTLLLWFGPALVLLLAGLTAVLYVRSSSRPRAGGEDLTAQEQAEVDRLLSPSDPQ